MDTSAFWSFCCLPSTKIVVMYHQHSTLRMPGTTQLQSQLMKTFFRGGGVGLRPYCLVFYLLYQSKFINSKNGSGSWGMDYSGFKGTGFLEDLGLVLEHLHGGSQLSITAILRDLMPSPGYIHTYMQILVHIKNNLLKSRKFNIFIFYLLLCQQC